MKTASGSPRLFPNFVGKFYPARTNSFSEPSQRRSRPQNHVPSRWQRVYLLYDHLPTYSDLHSQTGLAYARVWHHVDASDRILGKLAERIALVLMGKHKPIYDPSGTCDIIALSWKALILYTVDCGDYVIVTNSRRVKVTGRKEEQLLFRKHSMFPGGLKETPYKAMKTKNPDEVRVVQCTMIEC